MGTTTPYNEQYNPQADPTPAAGTDTSTTTTGIRQPADTGSEPEEPEERRAFIGELVSFKPLPSVGGAARAAIVMDVHKTDGTVDLKVFNGYGQSTTDVRDVASADSEKPGTFKFVSPPAAPTASASSAAPTTSAAAPTPTTTP